MNLVIDMGNTSVKLGLFSSGELKAYLVLPEFRMSELRNFLDENGAPENVILSSVIMKNEELENYLSTNFFLLKLDHKTDLPIKKLYQTPETLGNDRLAGAVGAAFSFPHEPVLLIDAGTCIKYDFVNAAGEYAGGAISPGLNMRFQAMHNYTARLPLINPDMLKTNEDIHLTGDSTNNSLLAGGAKGALFEMEGFINAYEERYPGLNVILTGGDASFFELHLKRKIFALPQLVLLGLNIILEHNLKQT